MRNVGTVVRGIRTPIIKKNDDLAEIVTKAILDAKESENFEINDRDIICVTEAVVGISENNYASVDDIAKDIKDKFKNGHIGVVFPILSRNRFALCLKGIARGAKKITMLLSYPKDEVGNNILNEDDLLKYNINPYNYVISEKEYKEKFGNYKHIFTGINMIDFYRDIIVKENCEVEFVLSNNPETILNYTDNVLVCDIHTNSITKDKLKRAKVLYSLSQILNKSINGSGYNSKYGLLGSNRATDEELKLFPEKGDELVSKIQKIMKEKTNKNVEVMVYGDGAFKDPIGGIWELADPVVSPFYTKGLEGHPNELKLKYLSDNKFSSLSGEKLQEAIKKEIKNKDSNLKGQMLTQGTTPRRYVDLIGSLADLTSGSGDKGTPVVYIQGYFDNYSD